MISLENISRRFSILACMRQKIIMKKMFSEFIFFTLQHPWYHRILAILDQSHVSSNTNSIANSIAWHILVHTSSLLTETRRTEEQAWICKIKKEWIYSTFLLTDFSSTISNRSLAFLSSSSFFFGFFLWLLCVEGLPLESKSEKKKLVLLMIYNFKMKQTR